MGLGLMLAVNATASPSSDKELLDVLLKKGTLSQEEYNALLKSTEDDVEVSTSGGRLRFKSGEASFEVGGRLMVDTARYYNNDDLNNGSEIRRARLFMSGKVYEDWKFKLQTDFAGNDVSLKDAYLRYTGLDYADITVGNFKEYWSLEELTSSKYITFMERALPVEAFAPGRRLGIGGHSHSNGGMNWTAGYGVFADSVDADNVNGNEGYGYAARVTVAPIAEKTRVVHLGGYAEWRNPTDSSVRYRARPESHISNVRFVDTGTINNVDNTVKWGVEAATVMGPFSLQGEYMNVDNDVDGGSDPEFDGWYAYGSWFITGESRAYKAGSGTFARVKPDSIVGKGGKGAWELGARYSSLDLNDSGIQGGQEEDLTIGLNWYATPTIRFMANYIKVMDLTDPTTTDDSKPDIYQLRAQIDF
ncbi:MAG TPA: OprO/OprP family phosphate-selective porin [Gammaproteobacteria bacterium]|nr:OprO/OprP family phosphate-selective porin [Gammaproteobacteria bacterium]